MAYRFKCTGCGRELTINWLKPGETAKCQKCGANVKVPVNAVNVNIPKDQEPLPQSARKGAGGEAGSRNCPTCRHVETINVEEFDVALPLGTFGACHRFPPGAKDGYPFLTHADWCGEYERKE
ncbi:MAG: hypothetical protein HY550_01960 [Elusimicrobia bacterium]|nr:hypothetical protein [Elusimicrobiota bacterium]